MKQYRIGSNSPRVDLPPKLRGEARYIDDLSMPGMLYGGTLRSQGPRSRLLRITGLDSLANRSFTLAGPQDIPGENIVRILNDDQPLLATDQIHHAMEPLYLLAHEDKEELLRGLRGLSAVEEPEDPVLTLKDALSTNQVIHRDGNLLKEILISKGDPGEGLQGAGLVLDREYTTGAQEQAYIEPQGVMAWLEEGRICVRGSMQCPYYVQKVMAGIFARPADEIRVIQDVTGGGFGGKEEYPSILAAHAALLALKSGRPVKMVYDRHEDMLATTKRHPSLSRIRAAFSKAGLLQSLDIEFNLDAGAYTTLSPVVLSRGALHAAGPYRCEHVRIQARAWATNTPPHGAFRGFGAPQSCFAIERMMDEAAESLGMDPAELRRLNFMKQGDTMATGQRVQEEIDLDGLLNQALAESDYTEKRATYAAEQSRKDKPEISRGIGLSCFFHGAGFTGSGEKLLQSEAALELRADGSLEVQAASTEIGQGACTVFTQIVCDTLAIDADLVTICQPDTDRVPDSGPTVASRTTMVVGSLIGQAAEELLEILKASKALVLEKHGVKQALTALAQEKPQRIVKRYAQPEWVRWDDSQYKGDAYPTYAWAVYVAEIEVDRLTAESRVTDFLAMQDVGRVINPILAEGQVEGGVAQGIGFALCEQVSWMDGKMSNPSLSNYILPTAQDLPNIRARFREQPWGYGPGGAKGLGELPMDGTAPAIFCALDQASSCHMRDLPALPEDLLPRMEGDA